MTRMNRREKFDDASFIPAEKSVTVRTQIYKKKQ